MSDRTKLDTLDKKSIAESVADIIRNGILTGKILPGEKLREQELCKELNISRTPLREAFRLLQSQNLIHYSPYVGVTVTELSPKFVREMWTIKSLLSPYTVAQAAQNATEKDVAKLEAIIDEIEARWEEMPEIWYSLDSKFHLTIAELAGNDELYRLLANLYDGTVLARNWTAINHETIKNSSEEHRQLVDAIAAKDSKRGEECMVHHLDRGLKAILAAIG